MKPLHSHPSGFYKRWGQRKYTPGAIVPSLRSLRELAKLGCWFYTDLNTPKHASILLNQSFARVAALVESQTVRVANRSPEFPYVFKGEWMKSVDRKLKRSEWWAKCSELPGQTIVAFTRRELLKRCIQAAANHTGNNDVRVTVEFEIES